MAYGVTAPTINPNTFPYLKKFTQAELDALFERIDYYRDAMTDMVGPSGVVMYIDAGTIANIAFHLAMVDLGYIWADVQQDQEGIFEGYVVWRLKKEHEPPPPAPVDEDAIAKQVEAARNQINKQLPPKVRKALLAKLAEEYEHDTSEQHDDAQQKEGEQ